VRDDILHFPPPNEDAQVLGHDGTLTTEEVEHLQSLGYHVKHYKAYSGSTLVQAYFEGLAKGLIAMDAQVYKSMDAIRKQLSKMDNSESTLKAEGKGGKPDVLTLLKGGVDMSEPIKRGPGRPPNRSK
jgi:hypothetical protein